MPDTIKAKFKVIAVYPYQKTDQIVHLRAADHGGDLTLNTYAKGYPTGDMHLHVDHPEAIDFFKEGAICSIEIAREVPSADPAPAAPL